MIRETGKLIKLKKIVGFLGQKSLTLLLDTVKALLGLFRKNLGQVLPTSFAGLEKFLHSLNDALIRDLMTKYLLTLPRKKVEGLLGYIASSNSLCFKGPCHNFSGTKSLPYRPQQFDLNGWGIKDFQKIQ